MTKSISDLEPQAVWQQFHCLTQVPRPSHHETKIQQFMMLFAEQNGLDSERDPAGNIIIRKPARPGYESAPGIILQGHLDMVPQANEGSTHDFANDPIQTQIEGDWVKAQGTTLGADNGMGVAAAMAILAASDIAHGPLEGLFTANEEDGMTGAFAVKPHQLQGSILLNMDSEEEGVVTVGCAGGINVNGRIELEAATVSDDCITLQLRIRGLKGGHSGVDIHRGRGNANKVLVRLLQAACEQAELRLAHIDGGSLRNAIAREATADFCIQASSQAEVEQALHREAECISAELEVVEPALKIEWVEVTLESEALTADSSRRLMDLIRAIPHGVLRMSDAMPGLVETSTNLAIVRLREIQAEFHCLVRSSVDSARDDLCQLHQSIFRLAGGSMTLNGAYPGWKPNLKSPVLQVTQRTYRELFDREAVIGGIHAGLECGILGAPMPHLDMVSFGPTIEFPHSPDERVHIPSVERFWRLLVATVESIAKNK